MVFCERIQECLPLEFRLQLGKLSITLRYLPVLLRYDPVLFGYRLRMFGYEFLIRDAILLRVCCVLSTPTPQSRRRRVW